MFKLTRPSALWIPPLLPLVGYGWAHWERALPAWRPQAMVWLALAWVALQVGTLWLNAARDQDTGETLFGDPVPVPARTSAAGLLALGVAVALAALAGALPGSLAAACAALAILYSHPRTSWKAHPVLGPLVNVVGYGMLSPLAGFAVVGSPPTVRGALILGLLAATALGWTFTAQAFQRDEDQRRGDRTMVAVHGPRVTLSWARVCFGAVGLGLMGLACVGWLPLGVLIACPAILVTDLHLAAWSRLPDGGNERWARRQVWFGLGFALLCVGGAGGSYVADSVLGRPVAGLGTRHGHPSDRLILPAHHLTRLDELDRAQTGRAYRPR